MTDDQSVPDGEVEGEPGAIRPSGGPRGQPDLAEHHRVLTVDQDPLDLCARLSRHMVGGVGAGGPVPEWALRRDYLRGHHPVEGAWPKRAAVWMNHAPAGVDSVRDSRRTRDGTDAMPLEGEYEPSPTQWVREQVELYESSGGTKGTTLMETGLPVILLTTVGAKSGKIRKTPLMRVEHDGSYAVVASQGGAPTHPVWYFNVQADPHVELQDGPQKWDLTAREVTGDEKAEWWERAVAAYPPYAEYQTKTDRQIPVFVLEPADGS
jgi:deazaflavin-dependent oxidoreductase (nitroreductase family)